MPQGHVTTPNSGGAGVYVYRVLQNGCSEQHSAHDSPLNFVLTLGAIWLAKSEFKVQSRVTSRMTLMTTILQNAVCQLYDPPPDWPWTRSLTSSCSTAHTQSAVHNIACCCSSRELLVADIN